MRMKRVEAQEVSSLRRRIGLGLLGGLVAGPLLMLQSGADAYGLWVPAGALASGGCAGWLYHATRDVPKSRPELAPWRGVIVGAVTAQSIGALATALGVVPLVVLPLWAVGGGAVVVFGKVEARLRDGEPWSGVTALGVFVAMLVAAALVGLSAALTVVSAQ